MSEEFQPTHETTKDFAAIRGIIERALHSKLADPKNNALKQCAKFLAIYEAKDAGMFDHLEGLNQALRRIRAITTSALPHNIDGKGEEVLLLEGEPQ